MDIKMLERNGLFSAVLILGVLTALVMTAFCTACSPAKENAGQNTSSSDEGSPSDTASDSEIMDAAAEITDSTLDFYISHSIVASGGDSTAVILDDGTLWAWGSNSHGEIGNGTTKDQALPVKVLDDAIMVSKCSASTAAIRSDNSLWTWGENDSFQLGNGNNQDVPVPVKVMDGVVFVSMGSNCCFAIDEEGVLWGWGDNDYGQLGKDVGLSSSKPVEIMKNVVYCDTDGSTCAAITRDKGLWLWGMDSGLFYVGSDGMSAEPVKVMDDVTEVSIGTVYACAVTSDGTLYTWGEQNPSGSFGDDALFRFEPGSVLGGVKHAVAYKGGANRSSTYAFTAIIKDDDSLWMCGSNDFGQLGDGTQNDRSAFVKVMDDASSVTVGSEFTVAMKKDGSVWSWGLDGAGTFLGDGAKSRRATPGMVTFA